MLKNDIYIRNLPSRIFDTFSHGGIRNLPDSGQAGGESMSQKSEKYARNLRKEMEDTKTRMTCTEEKVDGFEKMFDAVHTQAMENARQENAEARRHARQAERKARTWKHIAYAALAAAIIVEIIAIWAVRYKEPEVPPLVVLPEEQVVVVKQIGAPTIAQLIG